MNQLLLLLLIIGFQISSLNGVVFNPLKFLTSSTTSTQQQQQQQKPSSSNTTNNSSNSSITNSFNPFISLGNRENTSTLETDYGQTIAGVTINVIRQRSKRASQNNDNNDDAFTILQYQYYKSQLQIYGQVQQQTVVQNKNVALYRLTQRIQSLDGIKLSLTLQNNFYATRGINEIKQIESQLPSQLNCDDVKNIKYESSINDAKNTFEMCTNDNLNAAKNVLTENRDSLSNINNNIDKISEIIANCDDFSTTPQKTICYTNAIASVKGNTIKLKISIDTIVYTVESEIDKYQLEMSNCNLNINKIIAECKMDLSTAIDNCIKENE